MTAQHPTPPGYNPRCTNSISAWNSCATLNPTTPPTNRDPPPLPRTVSAKPPRPRQRGPPTTTPPRTTPPHNHWTRNTCRSRCRIHLNRRSTPTRRWGTPPPVPGSTGCPPGGWLLSRPTRPTTRPDPANSRAPAPPSHDTHRSATAPHPLIHTAPAPRGAATTPQGPGPASPAPPGTTKRAAAVPCLHHASRFPRHRYASPDPSPRHRRSRTLSSEHSPAPGSCQPRPAGALLLGEVGRGNRKSWRASLLPHFRGKPHPHPR